MLWYLEGGWQSVMSWLCRYGEAQQWTRDDAHGTWNSAKAVLSTTQAEGQPKDQASLVCTEGAAPVEEDMDEVHSLLLSHVGNPHGRLVSRSHAWLQISGQGL